MLGWSWVPAFLFGSLVIVTGPTVVTPLLRRIKVQRQVATVLEAEGVLVDAIGAIFAAVALQVVAGPSSTQALALAAWDLVARLAFGAFLGFGGGFGIAQLLRRPRIVPEGLENVFTLSVIFALFQISNAIFDKSGIVTVTAAGLAVGNVRTRALPDLLEFKEQLTIMLIGMLFVLLAADVRVQARVERWQRTAESDSDDVEIQEMRAMHKAMLPLAVLRGRRVAPIDATTTFKKDDALYVVLFDERREAGVDWLRSKGWEHVDVVRLKPAPEPSPAAG